MEGHGLGAHLEGHGLGAHDQVHGDCSRYLKSKTKCPIINLFHHLIIIKLCVRISDKQAIFLKAGAEIHE